MPERAGEIESMTAGTVILRVEAESDPVVHEFVLGIGQSFTLTIPPSRRKPRVYTVTVIGAATTNEAEVADV